MILGLAKSGFAAAKVLHSLGAIVTVNDAADEDCNEDVKVLRKLGVTVICGGHPATILDERFDVIVKNPGIPYTNIVLQKAVEYKIPIWTEIELAYQISEAPIIGITGSNGKTTTTTLLYHMLSIDKKKPIIAGNIGTVACGVAEKAVADEVIVLEASSFQLMGTETFKPKIAIITNLYDAHLDYHGTAEAYAEAKANITAHQVAEDYFIYNADQAKVAEMANHTQAQTIPFSLKGKREQGISADEDVIYWNGEPFIKRSLIKLPGEHNLENILCATAAAILYGCSKEAIEDVLSSFTGVRHRMQFVKEVKGRTYYNDSKATNTLATKSALASFKQPIVLLLGGLDRGHSFEELRPYFGNVKAVVALGETKARVKEFASSCHVQVVVEAKSLEDGVLQAHELSEQGDVILLSPASASWDEYASFEERGDVFIKAITALHSS